LSAHIGGAMTIDLAAHIGGDWVHGGQPHVADLLDHLLELLQILVEQEHPLPVVLANLLEDEDTISVRAGSDQSRHDGLIETVFRGQHNDVAGRNTVATVWPYAAGGNSSD
jgi:hypothetical protein